MFYYFLDHKYIYIYIYIKREILLFYNVNLYCKDKKVVNVVYLCKNCTIFTTFCKGV